MSSESTERHVHCGNDCRQEGCPGHVLKLVYHHTSDTVTVLKDGHHYATFDSRIWRAIVNLDLLLRERSDFGVDPTPMKTLETQAKEFNAAICEQEGYDPVHEDWILRELLTAYELGRTQPLRGDPASPGAGRATGR